MKHSVRDLHEHRRSLTHIRRYVWPLRDVINSLCMRKACW
jgi:Mg2+ and Co2+ transporter CorA